MRLTKCGGRANETAPVLFRYVEPRNLTEQYAVYPEGNLES